MYFADLENCFYHSGPFDADNWSVPLLAVGWLEHPHHFTKGDTQTTLLRRLGELNEQSVEAFPNYTFRGLHDCSLCQQVGEQNFRIKESFSNLFIPGTGVVYLAPAGIEHYIRDHAYKPPHDFRKHVLCCPDPRSPDYQRAMQDANAGQQTPLKAHEPFRFKAKTLVTP